MEELDLHGHFVLVFVAEGDLRGELVEVVSEVARFRGGFAGLVCGGLEVGREALPWGGGGGEELCCCGEVVGEV